MHRLTSFLFNKTALRVSQIRDTLCVANMLHLHVYHIRDTRSRMERISTARTLGAAISRARHAKGLTQAQLSEMAGVSRQLVNRLEMGTAGGISFDKLRAILSALECDLFIDMSDVAFVAHDEVPAPSGQSSHPQPTLDLPANYYLDTTLLDNPPKEL